MCIRAHGSIPAPAGETHLSATRPNQEKVHPRACGGNIRVIILFLSLYGPSPRLRGKRPACTPGSPSSRSIPAPAGETRPVDTDLCIGWVHPRACGGNYESSHLDHWRNGPSPRLRGKRTDPDADWARYRSIPAPAGETFQYSKTKKWGRVHPRACGGNFEVGAFAHAVGGPSPRLRGKRTDFQSSKYPGGSIPAPAGETCRRTSWRLSSKVHPRACGGNETKDWGLLCPNGPSPRLRGKLQTKGENHCSGGRLTTYSPSYSNKFLIGSPRCNTP